MEGTHTFIMRQITGKRVWHGADSTWSTPAAEEVGEAAGTQSETTYIRQIDRTVAQLVVLWLTFKVCTRDMGYEGRG